MTPIARWLAICLIAAGAPISHAHGQVAARGHASVRGTITGQGRPLAGVLVYRMGSADSTRSDSTGRYALEGLNAGRHVFQVRMRGFAPLEMEINFPSDTLTVRADIPMETAAAGDAVMNAKLEREGFLERRRNARERDHVTFLGPEDIESRDAARVSQLFDNVRDISLRFERGIAVLYGADGHCVMNVWLERQLNETAFPPATSAAASNQVSTFGGAGGSRRATTVSRYTGLDQGLIDLNQIGAIEIYPRPSLVPQDFQRSTSSSSSRDIETRSEACGAVIFWTR